MYQSFTDVLNEVEQKLRSDLKVTTRVKDSSYVEAEGGLALVSQVREELTNVRIVPSSIYRAVARAQIHVMHELAACARDGVQYSRGGAEVATRLLIKADSMAERERQ